MAEFRNQKPKENNQNIQVYVRVRPLNGIESKSVSVVDTSPKDVTVRERPSDKHAKKFIFDRVFGTDSQQLDVYRTVVHPLINEVLAGYNCTIFAYGQTGTGKTFTMEGEPAKNCGASWDTDPLTGIIPRTLSHIFDELRILQAEFTVRVTYLELYNEELVDLLSLGEDSAKIKLYEDVNKKGSVIINGLEEVTVNNKNQVYDILKRGSEKRKTASTLMNAMSSRSHSVFSITIHIKENNLDGEELVKTGKMNLVDLAGSECVGRSGAVDKRAREAGNINQSLLTLGRCITALVERAPHIPFRESKLTRLLQDSLGGKTKTSIIATVSPAASNIEETLSTLDYAYRAKNITNRPEINQKLTKKALLKEYTEEIETLRKDLAASRDKNGVYLDTDNYKSMISKLEAQEKESIELISKMRVITDEKEKKDKLFEELGFSLKEREDQLQATKHELDGTVKILQDTKTQLVETEQARDEQALLVEKHMETEEKLNQQAHAVLAVADESTTHTYKLQDSLLRKREVEGENTHTANIFCHGFGENLNNMRDSLKTFVQGQEQFCSGLIKNTNNHVAKEKASLAEISSQMTTLVSNLNDFMLGMQSKTSGQGQSSQLWIQQELTSSRSHSDSEANHLHQFLSELTHILQALTVKVQTLQVNKDEFSRSMDQLLPRQSAVVEKHFASMTQSFAQLQRKLLQLLHDHHAELAQSKNAAISFEHHQEESQQQAILLLTETLNKLKSNKDTGKKYAANIASDFSRFEENGKIVAQAVVEGLQELSTEQQEFNIEHQTLVYDLRDSCSNIVERTSGFIADAEGIKRNLEIGINDALRSGITAWKENYSRTEQSLRTRSEEVNAELQEQLDNIQEVQLHASNSANGHEALLEAGQAKLDVYASEMLTNIKTQCSHAKDWEVKMDTALHERNKQVEKFVTTDLMKDKPSGETPGRKEFLYSRAFAATSPHERIIARQRAQKQEMQDSSGVSSSASSPSKESPLVPLTLHMASDDETREPEKLEMNRFKSASTSNLLDIPNTNAAFNSSTESEPNLNEENKENYLEVTMQPISSSKAPSSSDPCLKKRSNAPNFLHPSAAGKIQPTARSKVRAGKTSKAPMKMPLSSKNKA